MQWRAREGIWEGQKDTGKNSREEKWAQERDEDGRNTSPSAHGQRDVEANACACNTSAKQRADAKRAWCLAPKFGREKNGERPVHFSEKHSSGGRTWLCVTPVAALRSCRLMSDPDALR